VGLCAPYREDPHGVEGPWEEHRGPSLSLSAVQSHIKMSKVTPSFLIPGGAVGLSHQAALSLFPLPLR
jgi:hypothetical protein